MYVIYNANICLDFYGGNSFISKYCWASIFMFLILHLNDLEIGV